MANKIKISGSLLAVNDNSVTDEGTSDGDYTNRNVDAHAQRRFGGKYNTLTTYTDEAIARFTNSVVAENNTTDGLDSNGWQEGAGGPTSGTLPATIYAISVKYVSKIGTVANVFVAVKSTGEIRMANLVLGESVVLPIAGGLSQESILIGASAYTSGTHEATVNILVMGEDVEDVELISHWIADNDSFSDVPNEIDGKQHVDAIFGTTTDHFNGHKAVRCGNFAQHAGKVVGLIHNQSADYSIILTWYTGTGWSGTNTQRFLSAIDSDTDEVIDILGWIKTDNTVSFYNALLDHPGNSLPLSAMGNGSEEIMLTIVFEDPDIRIYKNGTLEGTLANGYTKGKLDGDFRFAGYYGGGSQSTMEAAWAECKIFLGAIGDAQRIAAENAMATTYGITF